MTERREIIEYCLTLPRAYEDYPFDDLNWTVMRREDSRRGFAWIFKKDGLIWVNVKAAPDWALFWADMFPSVQPGYHMNKKHWVSIILDGSVPDKEIIHMINDSYELCK